MNQKYTDEMKQETVMYILETGKSYSEVSRELGLGKGTLYKWVSAYKQKNGIVGSINKAKAPASNDELVSRIKELEKQLKEKDKEIERQKQLLEKEKGNVEILKKSLHIFAGPRE